MTQRLDKPPSAREIRDRLHDMVLRDLLGPAGGPDEEIANESNVRDRYLVGVLAPQGVVELPAPTEDEGADDSDADVRLHDELAEGEIAEREDGKVDRNVPAERVYLPSSIGLTFTVANDTRELRVAASWGQYLREVSEDRIDGKTGLPARVWKRYARGGTFTLDLADGPVKPHSPDADFPDVVVKGRIRRRDAHAVVTLFLVNAQTLGRPKDASFVFQPELRVTAPDGAAVFAKRVRTRASSVRRDAISAAEEDRLDLLDRRHVEFAVGHGVSVHAEPAPGEPDCAVAVMTRVVPEHELPLVTAPSPASGVADGAPGTSRLQEILLDMSVLADADPAALERGLRPLAAAYAEWIDAQDKRIDDPREGLSSAHRDAARAAILDARAACRRVDEGITTLAAEPNALEAFRFMNRAMALQRTRSIYAARVRQGETTLDYEKEIDVPANRSWYPFQLGFILLNLPGLTRLDHPDRSESRDATADLLFFPTGGGKTEAYLGLSAYAMGLRRLQGIVEGRSGENGVAVLMRYTLRLLTVQQFQRATALLCACESIRRAALERGDAQWGRTPFRIGLWVGSRTTPNWTDEAAEAIQDLRGNEHGPGRAGLSSPYQLTFCPWCGSEISPGTDLVTIRYNEGAGRTLTYCGDATGRCPFSRKSAPQEGLPIVVVDEEIYRRLPSLVVATVDKFAQMPWKGEVEMLFGQVTGRCERHGFVSPEIEDAASHPGTRTGSPPARTVQHGPLRPPDLIIQDELHLISGPLGSLVGLYETAVDRLSSWTVAGRTVRPKLVASTATVRNASSQVHGLFLRRLAVFPPPGLDAGDSFFAREREPSDAHPGRLYLGICAPGKRLKAALIRVYVAYLAAAQALYEELGARVDPWMTLVGYFNSLRELGGMRRLVDDDVAMRAKKMDERGLAKRFLRPEDVRELTSRVRSDEIPRILDHLGSPFDPALEARRKARKAGDGRSAPKKPIDVLLATNMISVGVDVRRLGLMVVCGQPKSTAEYIQATSRVGRGHPGIVCTVFNWARPRDLSHYERFEHYHATFNKHVESLSVTPFAPGAVHRGLAGLFVALVRLSAQDFNENAGAARISREHPSVQAAIEAIVRRAEEIGDGRACGESCRAELESKLDYWLAEAQNRTGGRVLHFGRATGAARGTAVALLSQPQLGTWEEFTCLNSLRDVEPAVKLIVSDSGGFDSGGGQDGADDVAPGTGAAS